MKDKDRKVIKETIAHRGSGYFVTKAVEEMSELTKELCKFLIKAKDEPNLLEKIHEEIGHVKVMVVALEEIFDKSKIDKQRDERVQRYRKNNGN